MPRTYYTAKPSVNWGALYRYIEESISTAVDGATGHITEEAQRRAPVRKVFRGRGARRSWPRGPLNAAQKETYRQVTFGPYSRKQLRQAYALGTSVGDMSVGVIPIASGAHRAGKVRPEHQLQPTLTLRTGEKKQGDWRRVSAFWSPNENAYRFSMNAEAYEHLSVAGRYELHHAMATAVRTAEGRTTGKYRGDARGAISGVGSLTRSTSRAPGESGETLRLGGHLRESIKQGKTQIQGDQIYGSVEVNAYRPGGDGGANYAVFVEFGNGRGPAQPFLRPALVSAQTYLVAAIRRSLHDSFKSPVG